MAVPRRKPPRRRLHSRLVLGNDQRALGDRLRQAGVRRRIVPIDATAEHRHGVAVCLERAAMGLAVDPPRKTAHDSDARRRELAPEHARHLRPIRRAGAGTDDRDSRLLEHCDLTVASEVEPGRWIVNRPQ
jgi:hypothetical protein